MLWRDHTGPNAFRMLSEYECSVYFRNCPNALRIGLLHRMLSVCFPNDFSMLSEQAEYFPHVHIDRFPPRTYSVWFPNAFRIRRIEKNIYTETMFRDIVLSVALHRFDARTHNGRISHIIWILRTSPAFGKGSERVRYVLGLFGVFGKNTEHTGSERAVRKIFGKHIEIRKGYWKHSESIRHVLGAFGVFGKHTYSSTS